MEVDDEQVVRRLQIEEWHVERSVIGYSENTYSVVDLFPGKWNWREVTVAETVRVNVRRVKRESI